MGKIMSLSDGVNEISGERLVLDVTGFPTMKQVEKEYFLAVFHSVNGNKAKAAKILGISVKSVYNKYSLYMALPTGTNTEVVSENTNGL